MDTQIFILDDGGQDALRKVMVFTDVTYIHRQLSARLQCLQCVSNRDTAVLHEAIDMGIADVIKNVPEAKRDMQHQQKYKIFLVQNMLEFFSRVPIVPFFRKLQIKTTLRHKRWCVDCLSLQFTLWACMIVRWVLSSSIHVIQHDLHFIDLKQLLW